MTRVENFTEQNILYGELSKYCSFSTRESKQYIYSQILTNISHFIINQVSSKDVHMVVY